MSQTIAYLGPQGTFTHAAALKVAVPDCELEAVGQVTDVYEMVNSSRARFGLVAIESSVEGYVVPSLDALAASANVVAIDEVFVEISFDAFAHKAATGEFTEVTSHPHGLAQCQGFIDARGLARVPAASNAAACRDVAPHQIALGPAICGDLYGLTTVASDVQDFSGARTRFLLITARGTATEHLAAVRQGAQSPIGLSIAQATQWHSMIAITPTVTGPGVLARITREFGRFGVNLSSVITRPIKALEGKYTFILTVDQPPWQTELRQVLDRLLAADDALKTLGVFPSRGQIDDRVDESRLAPGTAYRQLSQAELNRALLWQDR